MCAEHLKLEDPDKITFSDMSLKVDLKDKAGLEDFIMCWISWPEYLQTGLKPKGPPQHWEGDEICQQLSGTVKVFEK